jgi:uncharacterized protein (DUF58 family)
VKDLLRNWFPTRRLAAPLAAIVCVSAASTWWAPLLTVAHVVTVALVFALVVDTVRLWRGGISVRAWREHDDLLSNGDWNRIEVIVEVIGPAGVRYTILDDLPVQLQIRDLTFPWSDAGPLPSRFSYVIRPVSRGTYRWGAINVFVRTRLGLVQRRMVRDADHTAEVYPSIIEMRRAELAAFSSHGRNGVHRQRQLGHTMEFEKVSAYASGDDVRTINWKATARRGTLMVNQYQEERSQDIYAVLDLGRSVRFAHDGMTMLDHAVNASLAFANVALQKHDRVGLITYDAHNASCLPAASGMRHLSAIMRHLYDVSTDFEQSDDERLVDFVRRRIPNRSLLMLFTNIESVDAAQRRIPAFRLLARSHLLVVNFFDNADIRTLVAEPPSTTEAIYRQTIARGMLMEKNEIRSDLRRAGITSVLSAPNLLSVSAINAYLDLKARGAL